MSLLIKLPQATPTLVWFRLWLCNRCIVSLQRQITNVTSVQHARSRTTQGVKQWACRVQQAAKRWQLQQR